MSLVKKQHTKNRKPVVLKSYSFTDDDINLITYALRRLKDTTSFKGIKDDSEELLNYVERLKQENK